MPLQWIFALVVTLLLVLVTLVFALPTLFGRELVVFGGVSDEEEAIDGEESRLLDDE